jgi:hypothetical protein
LEPTGLDVGAIENFRAEVSAVAIKRDLATATDVGARLNRLISQIDRMADRLTPSQRALLGIAHGHVRAMMNCPRRMRLDNTWQDDFVAEATKAADTLLTLARSMDGT